MFTSVAWVTLVNGNKTDHQDGSDSPLKQNNLSLVICVVISLSLGWRKDHLSPQGKGDPSAPPNEVISPYSTPDEGCFVLFCFYILLFNGFKSFQAKIYEINMYLLLYFIFCNHSVGIHHTATQKSHE